jgi:hypothetical protein
MKTFQVLTAAAICACATTSVAQTPAAAQAAKPTDIYHVLFAKAAPGQAAALAKQLQEPDPKDPMAAHFILLRHQEGADWDYCLIQHVGTKPSVEIPAQTSPATASIAWHDDSFVSGPSWGEFQKVMGLAGDQSGQPVYVVSVQRAVPGHRDQLLEVLNQRAPNTKVTVNSLVMTHVEGGPWQFLTLDRYNSWQDLGADRASSTGGQGWLDARQHSAYHTDTIADRVR